MNNLRNILWGIVFTTLGVIIGLNTLNITDINLLFDGWWTLFIIIPCFIGLFKVEDKTSNIIGLIIGIVLLMGCQKIIDFDKIWGLILPIFLIVVGLSFIFRGNFTLKNKAKKTEEKIDAIFSSQNIKLDDIKDLNMNMRAIFGGIKLDLTSAKITSDVVINTSCIFGGIDILVRDDINIKIKSSNILGGVSNNKKETSKSKYTIYINSTCIFGGLNIK